MKPLIVSAFLAAGLMLAGAAPAQDAKWSGWIC